MAQGVHVGVHVNGPFRDLCPQGLPHETISWWFPMEHFSKKLGLALLVCAIDVLESISIAKALAFKNSYELK